MTTRTNLRPAEYRALAELRYRIRRFLHFSEGAARDAGLEPQQHQLLLAIKGMPVDRLPTIGDLAERLQLKHNSANELVRRAEQRGLISTERGEDDRRQVIVSLTDAGEEALQELSLAHLEELRGEARALVEGLEQLLGTTAGGNAR
ncbi:MAG TPA: MarR family transcriptional regulator [Candidatus Limnocylindria bacterium]|jgi:DNA-binding MarR family transcriptional regulator|nr:MarR family transcriptional regulator [Candidatus Limnocylindria bacterium]